MSDDRLHYDKAKRLRRAIELNRQRLTWYREKRLEYLQQILGENYSESTGATWVPVPYMAMATQIMTRVLMPRAPRALITSPFKQYKPLAYDFELGLNLLMKQIKLGTTLNRGLRDAMVGPGIVKVAISASGTMDIGDTRVEVGRPYGDAVDFDDFVWDMSAKHPEQVQIIGDRYRLPHEYVMDSPLFDRKAKADLTPTTQFNINDEGDERSTSLGRGAESDPDDLVDMVEVYDIWMPREGLLVTVSAEEIGTDRPLRVVEWTGPVEGPYHILQLTEVPGNLMGLPPAATMMDLHLSINTIYRQLINQADRQKTLLAVAGDAKKDGERIVAARDGEAIVVNNPDRAREIRMGGIDQISMAFGVHLSDLFKSTNGNLDLLGGMGPSASTATAESIIQSNSSRQIEEMSDRTTEWIEGIVRALGHLAWHDPILELAYDKPVPGSKMGLSFPAVWDASRRIGDFTKFDLQIDVFSMANQSPSARLSKVMAITQQLLIPLAGQLQQQGRELNVSALIDLFARYSDLKAEFADIVTNTDTASLMNQQQMQQSMGGGGGQQQPAKPPVTRRESVRISQPGSMTPQGKSSVLMSDLLGSNRQPAEKAAAARG